MFTGRAHTDLHHGHFTEANDRGAESERRPACELIETKNPRNKIQSAAVKTAKAVRARKLKSPSTTKSLTSRCTTTIVGSKALNAKVGMG